MTDAQAIGADIRAIREGRPLVHNITNYVVMNSTANALLALGASPVMAHAAEEVEEMAGLAAALVLNIGTLSGPWIASMHKAARTARAKGIPIVLDPVGAGATKFRTAAALELLASARPAIVRGNASEIRALALAEGGTKGVDSRHGSEDALAAARDLASRFATVVSVSGAIDLIVGAGVVARVANGHPLMPRVTGLGCTASALSGAFAAVNPSPLRAAVHAMAVMGIAGEMAAERSAGPGSLQMHFLDVLSSLNEDGIRTRLRLEWS
jgi:hydroxyethylthiazole kinase